MIDQRLSCTSPVSAPSPGIDGSLSEPLAAVVDNACGRAALVAPPLTGVLASVGATVPVVASGGDPTPPLTGGGVVMGGATASVLGGTRLPAEAPVAVVVVTAGGVGVTEPAAGTLVMVDGSPVTAAGEAGPDPALVLGTTAAAGVVVARMTAVGVTQTADGVPVFGGPLVPVAVPVVAGWTPEVAGGAVDVLVVDGVLPLFEGVSVGPSEAVPVSRAGIVRPMSLTASVSP
jgi:hypothetical protein